jgi:drug/metabolite transporter (DMT)-like permease
MSLWAPALFVLLWSTGFIGAKYGLPYAEPFSFLALRLLIACGLLAAATVLLGKPWPTRAQAQHAAVAGVLLHAAYLGGVFWAIKAGMPAGIAALVVGLQPICTALLAQTTLGEQVGARRWVGLGLGLGGVVLVVGSRMQVGAAEVSLPALLATSVALVSITLGTVYQKRFGGGTPLLSGTLVQYAASTLVLGILAFGLEARTILWTLPFVLALAWLVVVLSFGAVLLLLGLLERNAASSVSSLFYLVPVVTALEAFFLFGEQLGRAAYGGMLVTVLGVGLVVAPKPSRPAMEKP